ncbi:hypothetical protein EZS27_032992, partial [termite gut metagenome]
GKKKFLVLTDEGVFFFKADSPEEFAWAGEKMKMFI